MRGEGSCVQKVTQELRGWKLPLRGLDTEASEVREARYVAELKLGDRRSYDILED